MESRLWNQLYPLQKNSQALDRCNASGPKSSQCSWGPLGIDCWPRITFLFCPKHYPQKSLIPMTHVEIPSQGQHSFSFDRLPGRGAAENRHRASNDVAAMIGGRTLWSRSRSQLPCPCLNASRNQKSRYLSSTHKASPLARCLFW